MSDECACKYFIFRPDCLQCDEPEGCPVDPVDYVATQEQPSQPIPVGLKFIVVIAGDYSQLNPDATSLNVGETFHSTIPNIQFPAGSQDIFSITSLAYVARGLLPFLFCCDPVNGICVCGNCVIPPCCDMESACSPLTDMICPPPVPCDIPICKEPLCCLSDGCNAGSVSAIPTKGLPLGTVIWVWLCREERFVKLLLTGGLPHVQKPLCGTIERSGCELEIVNSSGIGTLHYEWFQGLTGDVRCPVGADLPTFTPTVQDAFYWVRVRDDCSFCDSEAFFAATTLVISDIPDCPLTVTVISSVGTTTFQWFQGSDDSNPIAGGTSSTLDLTALGLPSDEYYWVRVTDDCGSVDSNTVFTPTPTIISFGPIGIEDATPFVKVVAGGTGPIFQWYKGLSGDTSSPLAGETTDTLIITPPVYDIFGDGESPPAGLTVTVLVDGDYTSAGGGAAEVVGNTFVTDGGAISGATLRVEFKDSNFWVRVSTACGSIDSPNTEAAPAFSELLVGFGTQFNLVPEYAHQLLGFGTQLNLVPEYAHLIFGFGFTTTDTTPPSAPTNLAANVSGANVVLNWDDNAESDLFGYQIFRSDTSGGPLVFIDEVYGATTSTYIHVGSTSGFYKVLAIDFALNESAFSNEDEAT